MDTDKVKTGGSQQAGPLQQKDIIPSAYKDYKNHHSRLEWDHLIATIALRIRRSLNCAHILQTTVDEVQQLLGCDRVLIYQFAPDWSGQVIVESTSDSQWSVVNQIIHDPCFEASWLEPYYENRVFFIEDVAKAHLTPCHADLMHQFQVRANLVVPIFQNDQIWGLLIVHDCTKPYHWQPEQIEGLQQLAVHVGIAIQQASLVEQLQTANALLETQVQERTALLEQSNQELLAEVLERKQATEAVVQREQFLRRVLDSLFAFVGVMTPTGTLIEVNEAPLAIAGLPREAVIGQPFAETFWWSDAPEAQAAVRQAIAQAIQGESVRFDIPLQVQAGNPIIVDFALTPLRDKTGTITHLIFCGIDISDRKHTEAELRQSKNQLEDFFDNAGDLIQSVSLENGQFLYVNRTWKTTLGYDDTDLASLTIFDIIAPNHHPQYRQILHQLRSGALQTLDQVEITFLTKNRQPVLVKGSINTHQEQGIPIAARAIFHDVTAQRNAEALLRSQSTILQIFYETCPLIMGVVELSEHDILHKLLNPATLNFFAASTEAVENQWASEIGVPQDYIDLWITHYRHSQASQTPVTFDYQHSTPTQSYWLSVVVSFLGIADSGRPQFSYIVQDVTEKYELQTERETAQNLQAHAQKTSRELELVETVFSLIRAGYWYWDMANQSQYLSSGFKHLFGYGEDELPNSPETWQTLIFPEDLPQVLACSDRHIQSGGHIPYTYEARYRHRDGSTLWIMGSGQVIEWDLNGNPLRMIGCHIDITAQKQTEETLRRSEATNRALIAAIPDFLVRMRQDGIQMNILNEGMIHCLRPEEVYGSSDRQTVLDIMPHAIAQERIELAQRAIATQQGQRQEYTFEDQGQTYYEEARIMPLWEDEVLVVVRDISDRKQAELDLQAAKNQLELFIQATSEGFWDWDLVTQDIYFSPRWKEMLGYADHELDNSLTMWESVIFDADRIQALQLVEDYNSGKTDHFCITQRFRHKNGSTVHILSRAIHLKNDQGEVIRMVGSHLDMTSMVAMQAALKTSEMQLSGILNSSLDGIMAFRSVRDQQGTIIDFKWLISNTTACAMVDRPAHTLIGKHLLQELPGHQAEGLFDLYVQVVESGDPVQRQFHYNHDGIDSWFENIVVKLGDGFAVTFRNITAVKQSEQALQQANQQLETNLHDLQQRNQEMVVLSEISDFLQACRTIEEACAVITNLVQTLFPGCSGGIFITSASRDRVEKMAFWGDRPFSHSDFAPQDCWGLRRGRPHWVGRDRPRLHCPHMTHTVELLGTLCVPMIAQGETLGLFHLSVNQANMLSEAKQQLAHTVAEQIGLAIANLHLRETLHYQSIRDPLTGLFNRRYLEESLTQELARAQRKQHPIGIVMIDIDHFKQFNDTHGHDAGDFVLQTVGNLIRENVRGSDIACRYGGEEMTLVLPESTLTTTATRAEALRKTLHCLELSHNGQNLEHLTASFGVSCFPQHGASPAALLQAADAALYRAKAAGRNQVISAI